MKWKPLNINSKPNWSERALGCDQYGCLHIFSIELTQYGYVLEIDYTTQKDQGELIDFAGLLYWMPEPEKPNVLVPDAVVR